MFHSWHILFAIAIFNRPRITSPRLPMSAKKIRVLAADAQPLLRLGLQRVAERAADIEVVAEAASAEDALRLAEELQPDVLLLGMDLPADASVAVARQLYETDSPVRVLALSGEAEEERHFFEMLAWRAAGYRSTREAPEALVQAIRAVAGGPPGRSVSASPSAWRAGRQRHLPGRSPR